MKQSNIINRNLSMGSNLLFKYGELNWLYCLTVEGLNDPPMLKYQDLGIQIIGDYKKKLIIRQLQYSPCLLNPCNRHIFFLNKSYLN